MDPKHVPDRISVFIRNMLDQSSFYIGEVLNSPFEIRIAYIDLISERNDQKRKYLLDHYNFNFPTFLTVFLCRIYFFYFHILYSIFKYFVSGIYCQCTNFYIRILYCFNICVLLSF